MSTLNYLGRREEGPHLLMGPIQGCGSFLPRQGTLSLDEMRDLASKYKYRLASGRSSRPSGGSKFRARAKRLVDHRLRTRPQSGLVLVGVGPTKV